MKDIGKSLGKEDYKVIGQFAGGKGISRCSNFQGKTSMKSNIAGNVGLALVL